MTSQIGFSIPNIYFIGHIDGFSFGIPGLYSRLIFFFDTMLFRFRIEQRGRERNTPGMESGKQSYGLLFELMVEFLEEDQNHV
jgi:hypothetical protein